MFGVNTPKGILNRKMKEEKTKFRRTLPPLSEVHHSMGEMKDSPKSDDELQLWNNLHLWLSFQLRVGSRPHSAISLKACFMNLNSMYCLRWASVLGQLQLFLKNFSTLVDTQYFILVSVRFLVLWILLLFGVQAQRVKSLKRIMGDLARHLHNRRALCLFHWCFSCPSQEGPTVLLGPEPSVHWNGAC